MIFHVDRSFQGDRSLWIEEAAWRLENDTRGKLRVEYLYDLDWDGRIQPIPTNEWFLVNLPEGTEISSHFDKKHGVKVLGECDAEHRIVYLLSDRLQSHDRFVHTTMHEILHSIGLGHVVDDAIVVPRLPLHMNRSDLEAFCVKVDCRMTDVLP